MAVTGEYTKVQLQHEPGEWVEVKQASMLDQFTADKAAEAYPDESLREHTWIFLIDRCVRAWSYPQEKNPESISRLDVDTVNAVMPAIRGVLTEVETKNSTRPTPKR